MATASSPLPALASSPAAPETPPRRHKVTYGGRRRDPPAPNPAADTTTSDDLDLDTSLRSSAYDTCLEDAYADANDDVDLDDEEHLPPSSEVGDSSMVVDTPAPTALSWRDQLKAIDDEDGFDEFDAKTTNMLPPNVESKPLNASKPLSDASPLSEEENNGAFEPSGSLFTASSPPTSNAIEHEGKRRVQRVVLDSDEEEEQLLKISVSLSTSNPQLSPTTSAPTSPEYHSSNSSSMVKGVKGRKPAEKPLSSTRTPLRLTDIKPDGSMLDERPKLRRGDSNKSAKAKATTKVKATTKKVLKETKIETARLTAKRDPAILREQAKPRDVSTFLQSLASASASFSTPTSTSTSFSNSALTFASTSISTPDLDCGCESDGPPESIQQWSSPDRDGGPRKPPPPSKKKNLESSSKSPRPLHPESSVIIDADTTSPSRPSTSFQLEFDEEKEDDDELELGLDEVARRQQARKDAADKARKEEDEKRKKKEALLKLKQGVLSAQKHKPGQSSRGGGAMMSLDSDDEDDLLVVDAAEHADGMKLAIDDEAANRRAKRAGTTRHPKALGVERMQELRPALVTLKGKGKATVAFTSTTSPSPSKRNNGKPPTRQSEIAKLRETMQAQNQARHEERRREFVQRGGRLVEENGRGEGGEGGKMTLEDVKRGYAERALLRGVQGDVGEDEEMDEDEEDGDEEDGEYAPGDESGSGEDEGGSASEDEFSPPSRSPAADVRTPSSPDEKENIKPPKPRRRALVAASDSENDSDTGGNENAVPVSRTVLARNPSCHGRSISPGPLGFAPAPLNFSPGPLGFVAGSLAFSTQPGSPPPGDLNLDGDLDLDKENDNSQSRRKPLLPQGSSSLSGSPARVLNFGSAGSPSGLRSRLASGGVDEADPFASPGGFRGASTPTVRDDDDTLVEAPPASFAPRFGGVGNGGFSQFGDEEGGGAEENFSSNAFSKLRRQPSEFAFTQLPASLALQPALQISPGRLRKADEIFEKEQEYVLEKAAKPRKKPKQVMYVNDDGFLTQNRPEGPDVDIYVPPATQDLKAAAASTSYQPYDSKYAPSPSQQRRGPLRTLSFTSKDMPSFGGDSPTLTSPAGWLGSDDEGAGQEGLRRLQRGKQGPDSREASPSPTKRKKRGAFDVLRAGQEKKAKKKEKLGRSEFVGGEAEEDEDEESRYNGVFGASKKGDEEEDDEDDDDQDKVVEGLVDDEKMDAEKEAADRVLEKHREHQEEEDVLMEKMAVDATTGKMRQKRRQGGLGLDDSDDSDNEEDDKDARARRKMAKKRKVGEDFEKFAEDELTRPFYNTYQTMMTDDDPELAWLKEQETQDVPLQPFYEETPGNGVVDHYDDDDDDDDDEREKAVSTRDIEDELRRAIEEGKLSKNTMNPHDTSWIDAQEEDELGMGWNVKAVFKKPAPVRRGAPMDVDEFETASVALDDPERLQMRNQTKGWVKTAGLSRNGSTARSGVSASAVTGHGKKIRPGGGGPSRTSASSAHASAKSASSSNVGRGGGKVVKTASVLSGLGDRKFTFE